MHTHNMTACRVRYGYTYSYHFLHHVPQSLCKGLDFNFFFLIFMFVVLFWNVHYATPYSLTRLVSFGFTSPPRCYDF